MVVGPMAACRARRSTSWATSDAAARANFRKAIAKDPNNWLLWADLATVSTHGAWRAPARRALELNPLAPELGAFRQALGVKG